MRNLGIKVWVVGLVVVLGMLLIVIVVQVEVLFKVGFVYVGLIGDYGWSYQYD